MQADQFYDAEDALRLPSSLHRVVPEELEELGASAQRRRPSGSPVSRIAGISKASRIEKAVLEQMRCEPANLLASFRIPGGRGGNLQEDTLGLARGSSGCEAWLGRSCEAGIVMRPPQAPARRSAPRA